MNIVRYDVIEQSLVVCNHNNRSARVPQLIHTLGDDFEGIDIQTRISFVQDSKFWFQHGHLEYLVAFFFTPGKSFVNRAV